ncbi:hypothetical protein EDC01DRAFT_39868 [Geopyxis carbonaria]|nr:hypothetical protein EDC01DRAFT_39868 [Geopyxis carbonaria]
MFHGPVFGVNKGDARLRGGAVALQLPSGWANRLRVDSPRKKARCLGEWEVRLLVLLGVLVGRRWLWCGRHLSTLTYIAFVGVRSIASYVPHTHPRHREPVARRCFGSITDADSSIYINAESQVSLLILASRRANGHKQGSTFRRSAEGLARQAVATRDVSGARRCWDVGFDLSRHYISAHITYSRVE